METVRYMTSLLTFYLKGEIQHEQNFVKLAKPNTILGLIPLGAKKESIPVTQLSTVESNFKLHFRRFLGGLILTILALVLMGESLLGGLLLLIVGVNAVLTAFETRLTIKTTSGEAKDISFLIFEKSKADLAEKQINDLVSNRLDDTNTRQQTDRVVDAINNK